MESWYRTELPKVNLVTEFLDRSVVLVMWHDSIPTYCQETFPYHISQQSVISAGLDWRDNNKFCHQVRPGVRHLTNNNCSVNAAPGAKSLLIWKVVSAPPDHNKNRETVNLDYCHQTGPVSGGTGNVYQNTTCPKCGTQSACRVQTKPFFFRELRKPWGLDPWYYKCSRRDTYSHIPIQEQSR